MEEMIRKKTLLKDLKGVKEVLAGQGDPILASVLNRAIECVERQQTFDVTITVECKECRQYDEDGEFCRFWNGCRHPEHFCGEGERKDDEQQT